MTAPYDIREAVNTDCPWSGDPIQADSLTLYKGAVVGFCNPECRNKFERAVNAFDAELAKQSERGNG